MTLSTHKLFDMRTLILNILFILLISFISYGQKYYTLTSGNYNNTTNVWSLNGVTPCGCFPSYNLISDTLIVNHPVNLTGNITANTQSKIQVNSAGSMSNSAVNVTVSNSLVLADGSFSINRLIVDAGATFEITNSTLFINASLDIYGTFISDFSNIYVNIGNIDIYPSGSFIVLDGTRIHFTNGNFENSGITDICSSCCISFSKGNVTNQSSGSFIGGGFVLTDLGNIKNFGSWSPAISWCSNGNDVGMTSPENCSLANDLCIFVPLPTELVYFDGFVQDEHNILVWETASENNIDYYQIDRSKDGLDWEFVEKVNALGSSQQINQYSTVDQDQTSGIIYYKLSQIDLDGSTKLSQTLSLINNANAAMIIYPNPTNDFVIVQLEQNNRYKTLKVVDAFGKQLNQVEIGDTFTLEIQLPAKTGIYFIQAEGEDFTDTYTLMKN